MEKKKPGLKGKERRAYALRMAIQLGCNGAHKMPDGSWAPCTSHEELMDLSDAAESNDWMKQNSLASLRARDRRARRRKIGNKSATTTSGTKQRERDAFGRWNESPKRQSGGLKKGLYSVVAGKSAVPAGSPRDTDPDVYFDPESARIRSRQLGCIGISRRVSRNGRTVWMPCTNMSDYSRLTRSTALGRRGFNAAESRRIRQTVRDELRRRTGKR